MDEIREFIKSKSITLTSQQFDEVLTVCSKYRISDFSSVRNRVKEVFCSRKHKRSYPSRDRNYFTCRACEREIPSEIGKIVKHIKSHFTRMDDDLKSVCYVFQYSFLVYRCIQSNSIRRSGEDC